MRSVVLGVPVKLLVSAAKTAFAVLGTLLVIMGIAEPNGTSSIIVGAMLLLPAAPAVLSSAQRLSLARVGNWLQGVAAASMAAERNRTLGPVNPMLVCPHCQTAGKVRTKPDERKTGVSGAKVAGAVLLGPISLLATGISSTEKTTRATCDACSSTWVF